MKIKDIQREIRRLSPIIAEHFLRENFGDKNFRERCRQHHLIGSDMLSKQLRSDFDYQVESITRISDKVDKIHYINNKMVEVQRAGFVYWKLEDDDILNARPVKLVECSGLLGDLISSVATPSNELTKSQLKAEVGRLMDESHPRRAIQLLREQIGDYVVGGLSDYMYGAITDSDYIINGLLWDIKFIIRDWNDNNDKQTKQQIQNIWQKIDYIRQSPIPYWNVSNGLVPIQKQDLFNVIATSPIHVD